MTDLPSPGVRPGAGPVPVKERRRANPSLATHLALRAAVAVLPAGQRHRYSLEFVAELHDVGRPRQLRHALGLLVHAWHLRLALTDTTRATEGVIPVRKPLRCAMHLHHYVTRVNHETADRYRECTRCGQQRDLPAPTYPAGAL